MNRWCALLSLFVFVSGPVFAEGEAVGTKPRPIRPAAPEYPKAEQDAGHEGRVTLLVRVRKNGKVEDVQVQTSSGFAALDEAAVAAARKWRFTPATDAQGKKVDGEALVPLQFKIPPDPLAFLKQPCSDLTKEVKAVRELNPQAKPGDVRTFAMTSGMVFLAAPETSTEKRVALLQRMPKVYEAVLVECEKTPEAIYETVLSRQMELLEQHAQAPPAG